MTTERPTDIRHSRSRKRARIRERVLALWLCVLLTFPTGYLTPAAHAATQQPEPEPETKGPAQPAAGDTGETVFLDTEVALPVDSLPPTEVRADDYAYDENGKIPFNPSPTRAVWLSALVPGLGQVYNRRYWKLPIIIAGFMGLGYGTSWNNTQFNDYSRAYADLMDADPNTKSYMDFFPPTTSESDLDHDWLARTLKNRKNYYRRNRELCIIFMVGVYLLCMVDAYVDATMAHFDISPDLSLDIQPTVFPTPGQNNKPSMGLQWALNF